MAVDGGGPFRGKSNFKHVANVHKDTISTLFFRFVLSSKSRVRVLLKLTFMIFRLGSLA